MLTITNNLVVHFHSGQGQRCALGVVAKSIERGPCLWEIKSLVPDRVKPLRLVKLIVVAS